MYFDFTLTETSKHTSLSTACLANQNGQLRVGLLDGSVVLSNEFSAYDIQPSLHLRPWKCIPYLRPLLAGEVWQKCTRSSLRLLPNCDLNADIAVFTRERVPVLEDEIEKRKI